MTRSHKQPYPARRSRSFDPSCRSHGSCPWCASGRMHKHERMAKPGLMQCGSCGEDEDRCYCYGDGYLDPWEGMDGN